ncbi:hypothetical protein E4U58_000323 [Claviceps cyperi]|nr:hypothetical protein E4U58_000323 [Claviceps cyperi]
MALKTMQRRVLVRLRPWKAGNWGCWGIAGKEGRDGAAVVVVVVVDVDVVTAGGTTRHTKTCSGATAARAMREGSVDGSREIEK